MAANFSMRLSADEIGQIARLAAELRLSKTEVVRLAVQSYLARSKATDQIAQLLGETVEEIGERTSAKLAGQADKNRRAFKLLLRVLKAPGEAEATLEKIYAEGEA